MLEIKNFISSVVNIFREFNVGHHCNRVVKIDVVCIVHGFSAFLCPYIQSKRGGGFYMAGA